MKGIAANTSGRGGSVTKAILISLAALVLFDVMGLIIKHLAPRYSAAELSAYRNIVGVVPSAIVLWLSARWHAEGRKLRIRQYKLTMVRGLAVAVAQLLFYLALAKIAFATAVTISYSNALFLTAFAVPLLGEKVGPIRWFAVLFGFVGVVLVMGPGRDSFTLDALLPLGAAALYGFAATSARMLDEDVPTPLANLYTQGTAMVIALVIVAFWGGFSPILSLADAGWIALMGITGGCAVLLLITAYRMTDSSNLAPFSYLGIPIAFTLGWLVFGEAPWSDLFPGALLIVASGLLIVWRERRLAKAAAKTG